MKAQRQRPLALLLRRTAVKMEATTSFSVSLSHRENKLQSVNHNPFTTHQHVTSVIFQEQGETYATRPLP